MKRCDVMWCDVMIEISYKHYYCSRCIPWENLHFTVTRMAERLVSPEIQNDYDIKHIPVCLVPIQANKSMKWPCFYGWYAAWIPDPLHVRCIKPTFRKAFRSFSYQVRCYPLWSKGEPENSPSTVLGERCKVGWIRIHKKIRPCHTEIKMAADIFERVLWSRPLQLTSFFVASLCCLDTGLLFQTVPFGRFVFDELFRDFLLYMIVYLRMHVDWPNLSGNTWYQQQIQLDLLIFLDVQHSKWWILLSHVYIYIYDI